MNLVDMVRIMDLYQMDMSNPIYRKDSLTGQYQEVSEVLLGLEDSDQIVITVDLEPIMDLVSEHRMSIIHLLNNMSMDTMLIMVTEMVSYQMDLLNPLY